MKDILKHNFENPDAFYRPAPFWSWNSDMNGDEIERQIGDFKSHGFGGAFAHPRLGMICEYLSDDYFRAMERALQSSKENGLKLYLYDENTWPSGLAGGLVPEADSETMGALAKYRICDTSELDFSGDVIFAAEYGSGYELSKNLTDTAPGEWKKYCEKVMVVYEAFPFRSDWNGGFSYTDLTNKKTIELFLKITHEEYYKRFAEDFGTVIPAIFSDEADIYSEGLNTVPYTPNIIKRFKELNGYSLEKNISAVFRNVKADFLDFPAEKIRHDYYYTLHELWIESFVKPISEWCDDHGIAWTGHDVEHQWPQAHMGRISPSVQTTYEFRQWPGLDLLLCDHLRDYPSEFDKIEMAEVRSSANQFAKKRTICEAYGAGGYHSTLDDYKRIGDYLFVNGINFLIPHLSLFSYMGSRKRDCPQSFDRRQPWWDEYTEFNDYFGRASYILSQGKAVQRILLLNPSTTGYLIPAEEAEGFVDHQTSPDCIKNPDMSDFLSVFDMLCREMWDFDIGDEYSVERNAKITGGRLTVGEQTYDTVVVSRDMKNIRLPVAELLIEFMKAGGTVVSTGDAGEYISGSVGCVQTGLLRSSWQTVNGADGLEAFLNIRFEKYIVSDRPWQKGVASIRRVMDDGRVCLFLVNHSMGDFECSVRVRGTCASEWNLFDGSSKGIECVKRGEYITFAVKLARCQSILIMVNDENPIPAALPAAEKVLDMTMDSIVPEKDNMLTLDHCSLEVNGKTFPERYFIETCDELFSEMDLGGDVWTRGIQFHTKFMDENKRFGPESAFKVSYRFNVKKGFVPDCLRAVAERPEVMKLSINSHDVPCSGEKHILGDEFGVFDISEYVTEGENVIALSCEKFDVLCEIEAVFLEGSFSVKMDGGKFVICPPESIGYGSWTSQGLVFYPHAVRYNYSFDVEKIPENAVLSLDKYEAAAVSLTVNGQYVSVIGRNGVKSVRISEFLKKGRNTLSIRVCGSYQNLLGPHLKYEDVMPYDWSLFEKGRKAEAEEYMFCEHGLFSAPVLKVSE